MPAAAISAPPSSPRAATSSVAEQLLGNTNLDGYFLEYDSERAGGFEPLRFFPKGNKQLVLGLVTSKAARLETKDDIKRRIDEATKYVALEQLCLSPQCGFASTEEGNVLAEDEQWAKLRMIVELADEVWGSKLSARSTPPFRADHVGSLLRTAPLKEARAKRERGEIDAAALKAVEDREIDSDHPEAGRRRPQGRHRRRIPPRLLELRFSRRTHGVEAYLGERKIKFEGVNPKPMMLRVTGKLGRFTGHPMLEHFKFVKAHTRVTPKMTIPSPSSLHFRYGRDAVPESIYPDMGEFYRDLGRPTRKAVRAFADAGCRYLQLDEVNFAYLCDPKLRAQVADRGDDPDKLPDDLCRHDQCGDLGHPGRHDHHHASVPRQFPIDLRRFGRLRAGGRDPVQHDQRARLLHGIRQRPRRRLRAAALRAQGQDGGARPGHLEVRPAGSRRTSSSAASTRRRSSCRSSSFACRRNAASPRPRKAISWPRTSNGPSSRMIVEVAEEVWG